MDQYHRIIVSLTEWYRLHTEQGPANTRNTYLAGLLPVFTFLAEDGCPWNAPPEQLRRALISFYRDRLDCQIHPKKDQDVVEITLTCEALLRESTLRVMRAALR